MSQLGDPQKIEQLYSLLQNAHVRNAEIISGVHLSDVGYEKLGKRLGASRLEIDHLLLALARKIEDEQDRGVIAEAAHVRFSCETDFLGNVLVRDANTGEENYFGGAEALALVNEIADVPQDSPVVQEILGHWMHRNTTKRTHLVESAAPSSFASEIKNETGSYNFPWRAKGKFGTATAAYTGDGDQFRLKVVDVRDHKGDEVPLDDNFKRILKSQALDFIGDE